MPNCKDCESYNICNLSFKEKIMSDKIEIEVKINGKTAKLSDVSDETLANIKKAEKGIKHGDYGYISSKISRNHRLFVRKGGVIVAYNKEGGCLRSGADVNKPRYREDYVITGNIFEDMENNVS